MKKFIRKFIPTSVFKMMQPVYHGLTAKFASIYFGNPSHKLIVVGVTGTAGKSTTTIMCAQILSASGKRAGYITTAGSFDGKVASVNKHGMSMPGGWMLQQQLAEMVNNGCKYAIIECTSEGLAQNRHIGVNFQGALFTNLSPAHIDAHGSFENYRAAKGKLFSALNGANKSNSFIGANLDDPNRNFFLGFPAQKKFGVSMRDDTAKPEGIEILQAEKVHVSDHINFSVQGVEFKLQMFGTFNVSNAMLAIGCAKILGVTLQEAARGLSNIDAVPGRMEIIKAPNGATVVVDYAPEPAPMEASLRAVMLLPHEKIIHVFGSTGGHRDVAKRFEFGKISAKLADTIIITNDDVYDSDPEEIAANIEQGINEVKDSVNSAKVSVVEKILDRKQAITRALQLAEENDIVLITGKGSEQFLVLPNNERIAWDERKVVKELLANQGK